tara:strand:+ start:40 stop:348 length:309 start_codon:yes stop_codon:yes gene_type:complete
MSRYTVNSDNNKKQQPKALSVDAYGKVTTPAAGTHVSRPNYVLVNMNGTYKFSYDGSTFVTGSVVDDAAGPVRIDIQPTAWDQTNAVGTVGDVSFVYTGNIG